MTTLSATYLKLRLVQRNFHEVEINAVVNLYLKVSKTDGIGPQCS